MTEQELPRVARTRVAELEKMAEELRLRLRKKRAQGGDELVLSFRQIVRQLERETGDGKVV
jgi:chemotaxis protein histidine kinase CheA